MKEPIAPRPVPLGENRRMILFMVALAIAAVFMSMTRWRSREPRDYYQFWAVGHAIKTFPVQDIYSDSDRSRLGHALFREASKGPVQYRQASRARPRLEPAGTPFLYAIFDLFSTENFERDYRLFRIFSGLCYVFGLFYFARAAGLGPGWSLLVIFFSTELFYPFRVDVLTGNVNQIQIGYLAVLVELSRRRVTEASAVAKGALLALGFFFKPTIAYVWLFLTFLEFSDGQWTRLVWQGVGVAGAVIVALLLPYWRLGAAASWPHWLLQFRGMVFRRIFTSQSMETMVLGIDNMAFNQFFSAIVVGATLALIWVTRPPAGQQEMALRLGAHGRVEAADFKERWLALALGIGVYIASAPLVHGHYFILMLPSAIYFLDPNREDDSASAPFPHRFILGVGLFLMSFHPFFSRIGFREGPYSDMWTHIGSMIITGLCARELYRLRSSRQ